MAARLLALALLRAAGMFLPSPRHINDDQNLVDLMEVKASREAVRKE